MTRTETLNKARAIAKGSTCFVLARGGVFKICRRIGNRIVAIGTRSDASQALNLLRRIVKH